MGVDLEEAGSKWRAGDGVSHGLPLPAYLMTFFCSRRFRGQVIALLPEGRGGL